MSKVTYFPNHKNETIIIAEKPYSDHPDDAYLSVVLVRRPDPHTPFVVWTKNTCTEPAGFSNGTYCSKLATALTAFDQRGRVD